MFKIYDGREHFFQWDLEQRLVVSDASVNEVHFCNKTDDCSLRREVYELDGQRVVDVPNILFQDEMPLKVYAFCTNYTKVCATFKIHARSKPEDYIYTDDELLTWEQLNERINQIEEHGISDEKIAAAIEGYLDENPIETGATEEEAAQIEQNKTDIATIQQTMATTEYVDKAVENVDVDLTGYATEKYVDDAIAAIDIPEGGGVTSWNELEDKPFYTGEGEIIIFQDDYIAVNQYGEGPNAQYKGEVEFGSIDVLTTGKDYYVVINDEEYKCTWVQDSSGYHLGNYHISDKTKDDTGEPFVLIFDAANGTTVLAGAWLYTTEAGTYTVKLIDLDTTTVHKLDARYLPENVAYMDDLSDFATELYVNQKVGEIEIPDTSNFATKDEIPDVSGFTTMAAVEAKGYQTEDDVNTLINTALGVIENGTY